MGHRLITKGLQDVHSNVLKHADECTVVINHLADMCHPQHANACNADHRAFALRVCLCGLAIEQRLPLTYVPAGQGCRR